MVPLGRHRAWHLLFSNMEVQEIANYINKVWIDRKFKLVVEKR
jgi:hypothetical protein